jgi:anti-sigma B factor antagonist
MEIITNTLKHCDLVKVKGRIDSQTAPSFSEAIQKILDQDRYHLVVDFEDVDFISSAGLRVLIATQKTCRRFNRGEIILSNVKRKIYTSLDLAGFTSLFKIFEDTVSAIGSF